jgi:hypothetical protein
MEGTVRQGMGRRIATLEMDLFAMMEIDLVKDAE